MGSVLGGINVGVVRIFPVHRKQTRWKQTMMGCEARQQRLL